jgi:prefoldin subunit 5
MSMAMKNLIDKNFQELADKINQQAEAIRQLEQKVEQLKEKWTTLHLPRSSR